MPYPRVMDIGVVLVIVVGAVISVAMLLLRWKASRSADTVVTAPDAAELKRAQWAAARALTAVTFTSRVAVRLAVRRGRRVTDPRMAGAAAVHARRRVLVIRKQLAATTWPAIIGPFLLAGLALGRLVREDSPWWLFDILLILACLAMVPALVFPSRAPLLRAQRAEDVNQELVDTSLSGS